MGNTKTETTTDVDDTTDDDATDDTKIETTTDVDDTTDDDAEDDEDAEAAVIATFTPAQAALWTAHQERLSKVNAKSRSQRMALKALRSGQQAPAGSPTPKPKAPAKTGEQAPAFDPEAFKASLLAEISGAQQADKVQRAAERGLKTAGLILPSDPDAAERKLGKVLRMLDLSGCTPDDVADEIDDLKQDSPELFGRATRKRPRTGGVAGPATIKGTPKTEKIDALFD